MYRGKTKVVVAFVLALGLILSTFSIGFAAGPNAPKLPEPPAVGNPHGNYVALGDSLAAGMTPEGGFGPSYADMLAVKLTDGNSSYSNFGIPGLTSDDLKNILAFDPRSQSPTPASFQYIQANINKLSSSAITTLVNQFGFTGSSIELINNLMTTSGKIILTGFLNARIVQEISQAEIITLDIGGNDALLAQATSNSSILSEVQQNILKILSSIKTFNQTDAKIYVMGYPYHEAFIPGLNTLISLGVNFSTLGAIYVSTSSIFVDKYYQYLPDFPNNAHPTKQGCQALAKELWSAILNNRR